MAEKEATVYIVDVGASMGKCRHGREISDLTWAMRYVWDRITTTVATGRKTATVGVVGLRTDGTSNELGEEYDSYHQLSVFQNIGQILMPDLRKLEELIKPSKTDEGDAISAIVLAIHMINKHCKKLKYKRKIVLVTNGKGGMNSDGIDRITNKLEQDDIELVVLGVDFDDPEYGFKEEDKDPIKATHESLLSTIAEGCDGIFGTLEQATSELDVPRVKVVRSMPSFKGELRLGNPEHYSSALCIQVERYYRTYVAKPPSASTFVRQIDATTGQETERPLATTIADGSLGGDRMASVRNARAYQVDDEEAPGGKIDVEREELAKGYEYGRTAVHISESDENITKLETEAALELIGFIPKDKYQNQRYMHQSTTNLIIGQKTNDKAILALSSIIHALFELECYAVARLVTKSGKPPLIVLLAPSIEPDFECLLEVQLPFAEDVRSYRFPPLDRVVTVSGKAVTEHRNLPSDELMSAMGKYVDSMELTDKDGEGEEVESLNFEDSFSPLLHRIDQAVRWRAIHPNEPIPPLSEVLQKLSHQPEDLQTKSKKRLEKLIATSDVKKIPPRTKGRKRNRETEKPLSGLDVDEILHGEKRNKISRDNAIPEFKQALDLTEDIEGVADLVKQMGTLVENQIEHSLGENNYDRVIEMLGVMKEELVAFEEPNLYNQFLRDLKKKILGEKLGGDRREMWWLVRKNRVGLIDQNLSSMSDLTEQEAKEFLYADSE